MRGGLCGILLPFICNILVRRSRALTPHLQLCFPYPVYAHDAIPSYHYIEWNNLHNI